MTELKRDALKRESTYSVEVIFRPFKAFYFFFALFVKRTDGEANFQDHLIVHYFVTLFSVMMNNATGKKME